MTNLADEILKKTTYDFPSLKLLNLKKHGEHESTFIVENSTQVLSC